MPGAETVLAAFERLAADRPIYLAMDCVIHGRISYLSIERYAARQGIDADDFERFDRLIGVVDAAEVEILNKRK